MRRQQHGEVHNLFGRRSAFHRQLELFARKLGLAGKSNAEGGTKNNITISKGIDLLYKKGIYPYEYMDSWERFNETSLPEKEMFYSKLNDEHITEDEYAHAQTVWETFECKTLGDYHDLYVKTDVSPVGRCIRELP